MKKLYFSYGMNTNLREMQQRCPDAVSLGAAELPDYKIKFKHYATIALCEGSTVQGVLWEISPADEYSLDVLEGYPIIYGKIRVGVRHQNSIVEAMVYIMLNSLAGRLYKTSQPSESYYRIVEQGYIDHGLNLSQLTQALLAVAD